jgi:hypothetical protein
VRLKRFRTGLAIAALAWPYTAFLILKHFVCLQTLARWAWCEPTRPRTPSHDVVIVERMRRLSKVLRVSGDCLPRSLLLYRELSKQGADPHLLVGFIGAGSSLIGHAWIVVKGEALLEPADMLADVVQVCEFGPHGQLLSGKP